MSQYLGLLVHNFKGGWREGGAFVFITFIEEIHLRSVSPDYLDGFSWNLN